VKILYNTKNPNRVDEFQAIQSSAAKAGFQVVDGGDPKWSTLLSAGNYDASLFGWISRVSARRRSRSCSRPTVVETTTSSPLPTTTRSRRRPVDKDKLTQLLLNIDKTAFTEGYGLPLFQAPGIYGVSSKLDGVKYMGNQTGPIWNNWEWSVKQSTNTK
jgi:peptide/nickel transport system substrate-binding protein